jgi:hypothetical protein
MTISGRINLVPQLTQAYHTPNANLNQVSGLEGRITVLLLFLHA